MVVAPYWPDGFDESEGQPPLLARDIGSAPRLSAFAFRQLYGFDLDLADLSAHLFASQPATPDLVLPESIWNQHLRGVAHAAAQFLNERRANIVLIPHGAEVVSRLLAEMTTATNRKLLFWESAFFPGFHYVDPCGPHFFRGEARLDALPLTSVRRPDIEAFIDHWRTGRVSKYPQMDNPALRQGLKRWISSDPRPVLFLVGQIATDANAVVGLGDHDSLADIYRNALSAVPADWRIVYKPHPLAKEDVLAGFDAPADRFLRTDADIHDVFAVSAAVMAFSSNVGLEALLAGLPVALLGRPVYSGRGLTQDLAAPGDVTDWLASRPAPPDAANVSAFVALMLDNGLTAEGDADGLARLIAEAHSRRRRPRLPWYGSNVQALGKAARALTAALAPDRTLAQALAAMTKVHRSTLFRHVAPDALATHPFGGPIAETGRLAPRPRPDLGSTDVFHDDLKLEECIDPQTALTRAVARAGPTATLCLTLPSANACPPDAVQRLTREDLERLCNRCDPLRTAQILGLEGDRWTSVDHGSTWVVSIGPPGRALAAPHGRASFMPWVLPPRAFTYRTPTAVTAQGALVDISPGAPAVFGPHATVPPGTWRATWRIRPASLSGRVQALFKPPRIALDVLEHLDDQLVVVARTTIAAPSLVFTAKADARYEFRISGGQPLLFYGIQMNVID
ncbi:hypothetical protein PFY01_02500 [Brevundimonas vesicularis]|uniref:capsular polysaccharide export protein, LipB/KpsS family n=1 Tax=Brevundimonas vesicularis TaxID=41276 RepID=UPI0022EC1FB6|nr:hypothetical protein [Brevundimonas vesicularis]WBT06565.1 hypothetical protein PFY01_02500 [Brevundimonas vesicularis]